MGCSSSTDAPAASPTVYDPAYEKARAEKDEKIEQDMKNRIKVKQDRYAAVDNGKFELSKEEEKKQAGGKSMLIFEHQKVQDMAKLSGINNIESLKVFATIKDYMTKKGIEKLAMNDFLICMAQLQVFNKQEELAKRFFKLMDTSKDDFVDFGELIAGLNQLCKGTRREKLKMCFDAYDHDQDAGVSKKELASLLQSQVRASLVTAAIALESEDEFDALFAMPVLKTNKSKVKSIAPGPRDDSAQEFKSFTDKDGNFVVVLKTYLGHVDVVIPKSTESHRGDPYTHFHGQEILDKLVDQIFLKYDKNNDESINFEEFVQFTADTPELCSWFGNLETKATVSNSPAASAALLEGAALSNVIKMNY